MERMAKTKQSVDFLIDTRDKLDRFADSVGVGVSPLVSGLTTAVFNLDGMTMDFLFETLISKAEVLYKAYAGEVVDGAYFFAERHYNQIESLLQLAQYIQPLCEKNSSNEVHVAGKTLSTDSFKECAKSLFCYNEIRDYRGFLTDYFAREGADGISEKDIIEHNL